MFLVKSLKLFFRRVLNPVVDKPNIMLTKDSWHVAIVTIYITCFDTVVKGRKDTAVRTVNLIIPLATE